MCARCLRLQDQCKLAGDDLLYDQDLGQSPNLPHPVNLPEDATLESLGLGDEAMPAGEQHQSMILNNMLALFNPPMVLCSGRVGRTAPA